MSKSSRPYRRCPTGNGCFDPVTGLPLSLDVFAVNQHFRTPYFLEYSLNVQKGLGNMAVWQVGYVGTQGRRLSIMQNIGPLPAYANFNNINQLSSIGTSFTAHSNPHCGFVPGME